MNIYIKYETVIFINSRFTKKFPNKHKGQNLTLIEFKGRLQICFQMIFVSNTIKSGIYYKYKIVNQVVICF